VQVRKTRGAVDVFGMSGHRRDPAVDRLPIWPTTTRSSIVPWRSGPNRSSQGAGRGPSGRGNCLELSATLRRCRSRYQARLRRPCVRARLATKGRC
jgi:hypothetical protein